MSSTPGSSESGTPAPAGGLVKKMSLSEIRKQGRKKMSLNKSGVSDTVYDPDATALASKERTRGVTGLWFDERMTLHKCFDDRHIEKPERLKVIQDRLKEMGLWDRMKQFPCREATDEELLRVHTPVHLEKLRKIGKMSVEELKKQPVYANEHTETATRLAAGSSVEMVKALLSGEIQNGICLVRPPGHHAGKEEFEGYCLCNNVAVAARQCLKTDPSKKVLIVDWDIHHGQATQDQFYDDPRVLFFSTHRFEKGLFWPHLRRSMWDHTGEGDGAGFNCNLSFDQIGVTNKEYLVLFLQVLLPLVHEFQPDLILVSCGFDSAYGDPEGQMNLKPAIYGHLVHLLMGFAAGKVGVILEGGYFLDSVAEAGAMVARSLLGDFSISLGPDPKNLNRQFINDLLLNSKAALHPFWTNLGVHEIYSREERESENNHVVLVDYQGQAKADEDEKWKSNLEKDYVYNFEDFCISHKPEVLKHFTEEAVKYREDIKRSLSTFSNVEKRLGFVYDEAMMKHEPLDDPLHPEKPGRIQSIFNRHMDFGILDRFKEVKLLQSRKATEEEICMAHDEEHWKTIVEEVPKMSLEELDVYADSLESIYLNMHSTNAALLATGSTLEVVDAVCNNVVSKGVAVVRPPGHHAEINEACGFCIFNNVGVGAKYAQKVHGVDRILILDWDVHHGNGIQNMFYDDDRVLYISLHRFDNGMFFPGRPDGGADFVGDGRGKGYNINIPWNGSGIGDTEYALAFYNIVMPVSYEFDPQLIFISAGFDAARGDPLGRCKVSPEMYFHMAHMLSTLANGRVICALEGGYNFNSISLSMTLCTKALLGDPAPALAPFEKPLDSALDSIRRTVMNLVPYWDCLKTLTFKLPEPKDFIVAEPQMRKVDVNAGGDSIYIPPEYFASENTSTINSVSSNKTSHSKTSVSESKNIGAKELLEEAVESLKISEDSKPIKTPNRGEYVPNEYGNGAGSSFRNTISHSSTNSKTGSYTTDSSSKK